MSYSGEVVKRVYGAGSKSHHDAIFLVTEDYGEYKLRRAGGNPFEDKVLENLVGMAIECQGTEVGSTLIIESWDKVSENRRSKSEVGTKKESKKQRNKLIEKSLGKVLDSTAKKKSTKKKSTKKKSTKKKSRKEKF